MHRRGADVGEHANVRIKTALPLFDPSYVVAVLLNLVRKARWYTAKMRSVWRQRDKRTSADNRISMS
jgi:hypothetical protein